MNTSIIDWFGCNLSPQERMRLIKDAGFSGVMLLWADYFDKDYKQFQEYARSAGLFVENAHAPYQNADALWEDTTPLIMPSSPRIIERIKMYEQPNL